MNGLTTGGVTINFGYIVSDSFVAGGCQLSLRHRRLGVPRRQCDGGSLTAMVDHPRLLSACHPMRWGTPSLMAPGTASGGNLTDKFLSTNQYGYDIDRITVTGLNLSPQQR